MHARSRARRVLFPLLLAAAALFAVAPTAAIAQEAPAPPTIRSPKPSRVVTATLVVTGRVGPLVTEVRVTGALATTVTLLPADSEGATFSAQVRVRAGRTVLGVEAREGEAWSAPATRAVWNLGAIPQDKRLVLVDKSDFMLYVLRYHVVIARYPIAIGMRGTPTPSGTRYLARPSRSPNGVWGPFRMRLFRKVSVRVAYKVRVDGRLVTRHRTVKRLVGTSYYIHGTNDPDSIGTPASHGCIRMWNKDLRVFKGLTYRKMLTIIRP